MKVEILLGVWITTTGLACAQESKLGLSGIFDTGSTNSRSTTQFVGQPSGSSEATNLNWGVDLNLRTFVLDPRFITLTLEPSIHRGSGRTDSQGNHEADLGGSFYLDFLKDSFLPFRFHFIDQGLSYQQEHLNSASVTHRSIGFDWTLRKPKRPPLFVSYDTSRFNYEYSLVPASVTRTSSLSIGTQVNFAGWNTNAAYSHQASAEAYTGLGTASDLIRGSASRKVGSKSQLSTNALYEQLRFSNQPGTPGLNVAFLNIRTDLRTRHSDRLSTMLSHQYYRTGGETAVAPTGTGSTPPATGSTTFNDVRGQVSYRLSSSLSVGGGTSAAFVSTPFSAIETATRTVSVLGNIHWQRKIKFLQTRAGEDYGIEYAASNMGHSREIPLQTSTAGLSVGDPRRVLISADGNYSRRPDLFEIGGSFTQRDATASLDTQAIPGFHLRGSAGINEFEFLTLRGRERFHVRTYAGTVSRSIFSLTASRNADISLRNLLEGPLAVTPQQLFITLPVGELLSAPFSATTGVATSGAFNVRPRRWLEFDARYLRQRILFTNAPSVLLRQYEAYGTCHVGKFLLTAGVLYLGDTTENEEHNLRRYYFFRISRPFRIF